MRREAAQEFLSITRQTPRGAPGCLPAEDGMPFSVRFPRGTGAGAALLKMLLDAVDDPEKAEVHERQRWAAEKAIRELCTRINTRLLGNTHTQSAQVNAGVL